MIDHLAGEGTKDANGSMDEEDIADTEAADFCVPAAKMASFYARKHPYFSERDVLGFAALMAVHPAIVVGQLQKRMKRFDYLRKYQVPIRRYLLKEAVADGWGNVPDAQLRSEEHTSELQSLMRISYAVFCLQKKNKK